MTEHTKELSYWEADPEGKLEKWLLLMIVDKFASVRTDGDRQSHVSRIACIAVYVTISLPMSFEPIACKARATSW